MPLTAAQLIAKLQTVDPNAIVLGDIPFNFDDGPPLYGNLINEMQVIATGIGYKLPWGQQNAGQNLWVASEPWEHEFPGLPLDGQSCVYIGTGHRIKTPIWQVI